jgi:High potential iron-sulfur protein
MQRIDRQSFLKGIVLLPGLAGLLTAVAAADSKSSQASMHYQTTPNDGKQCSGCQFFIPGQDPKGSGSCKLVDGSISPNGYCIAYTAK